MMDTPSRLSLMLARAADRLQAEGLDSLAGSMSALVQQVGEPGVVAVVGAVKAGKSSFINALLGQDLATVGTTETTATINYFVYGEADPARPVRCYWRNARVTDETPDFLASLQGHDEATLRRAVEIDHLEYRLSHPLLQRITLVDTPGTGSVVDAHQNVGAGYMALAQQLRDRHHADTERIGNKADAVIYLLGAVARADDRALLEEFKRITGSSARASNALGVLAKIDLNPVLLQRREELAGKIARELGHCLNTVVPVSAGLRRAIQQLKTDEGRGIETAARILEQISQEDLELLLSDEGLFLTHEDVSIPVSCSARSAIRGDAPWAVFEVVARHLADSSQPLAQRLETLENLAGFGTLETVLDRHFCRRSSALRSHRIVNDARALLSCLRFDVMPEARAKDQEVRTLLEQAVHTLGRVGEPGLASGLSALASGQGLDQRTKRLESLYTELGKDLAAIGHELDAENADHDALLLMEDQPGLFTEEEQDELRALFGLYGSSAAQRLRGEQGVGCAERRQQTWRRISQQDVLDASHHAISERAWIRYGLVLKEVLDVPASAPL